MDWSNYFYYDETSPSCLRWRIGPTTKAGKATKVKAGDVAGVFSGGAANRCGSWKVKLDYKMYLVHRIVYHLVIGPVRDIDKIDHKDGNSGSNVHTNLRIVTSKVNSRNQRRYKTNKSGVSGVFLFSATKHNNPLFRAVWHDLSGKQRTKNFSTIKHGHEEAFQMACEYRNKMIAELNEQGAGYTDRHGKE